MHSPGDRVDVTGLLNAWSAGDAAASEEVVTRIYEPLRRIARRRLRSERVDHTLDATSLVHEAYLRLVDQSHASWKNRVHFFAIASTVMRRILVDHARRRARLKRGAGQRELPLDGAITDRACRDLQLLRLDEALRGLESVDPAKARIVELHFFAGLSVHETAHASGCSPSTVTRHWRMAKAWLQRELARGERTAPHRSEA